MTTKQCCLEQVLVALLRTSAYRTCHADVTAGVLDFYTKQNLYPDGVNGSMPSVQAWAGKLAIAMQRLVPWM